MDSYSLGEKHILASGRKTTLNYLEEDIEAKLNLKPGTWPGGVSVTVSNLQATLVFCYRIKWKAWTDQHLNTLSAWFWSWGRIQNLPINHKVLVFFVVEYEEPKETLVHRLDGLLNRYVLKKTVEHPIHNHLRMLARLDVPNLTIEPLPELGNVILQDIEDWIFEEVKPPDPAGMIRLVREILDDPDIYTDTGVPMYQLAKQLSDIIEEAGKRL